MAAGAMAPHASRTSLTLWWLKEGEIPAAKLQELREGGGRKEKKKKEKTEKEVWLLYLQMDSCGRRDGGGVQQSNPAFRKVDFHWS